MAGLTHDEIVPFPSSADTKKRQVATMFDQISGRYDFLNRFLSAGIDQWWRKRAISELRDLRPQTVLDVATGTGDLAILTYRMIKPRKIVGIDISEGMLEIGRQKIEKLALNQHVELLAGDSEAINFPGDSFDAVTVAFGVRNFENLHKGLSELFRVLRPGGKAVILEFSQPKLGIFNGLYEFYTARIAPVFGKWFCKNQQAYQYLHSSVKAFPEGETFLHILKEVGFQETTFKRLSLGICTIYCGKKGNV
jgi:demethylmenaquinone methyltransferase / 2-methoxy-6-polyprenyl-1,4-benzoquinol methylase